MNTAPPRSEYDSPCCSHPSCCCRCCFSHFSTLGCAVSVLLKEEASALLAPLSAERLPEEDPGEGGVLGGGAQQWSDSEFEYKLGSDSDDSSAGWATIKASEARQLRKEKAALAARPAAHDFSPLFHFRPATQEEAFARLLTRLRLGSSTGGAADGLLPLLLAGGGTTGPAPPLPVPSGGCGELQLRHRAGPVLVAAVKRLGWARLPV